MSSENPKGIIELGTLSLKCIIFKIGQKNDYEILSTSTILSEGIHNGVIININKATNSIRSCVSDAEKKAQISLKKINVIIEQPEFLCTNFSKTRKIGGSKIDKDDIEFLLKESKKEVLINDNKQSIIHIFNHNYIVDKKSFVEEPINVYADSLFHEMTFITMPKNNLKNINQSFVDCDIEVERIFSSTFVLGAELFNSNQLKFGSALIDIGHEKISLGLFKNFAMIHSTTIPIGINHITKDISKVCSLEFEEAESIKNKIDFSFNQKNQLFDQEDFLKSIYFTNTSFRKISKNLLFDITKERLNEIFSKIKKELTFIDTNLNFSKNLYITGGGSNLINFNEYCSNFFRSDVKKLNKSSSNEKKYHLEEKFHSCLGALKIIKDGWETEAIPESAEKYGEKLGFFARIFGYGS